MSSDKEEKDLSVTSGKDLKKKVSDVKTYGNPDIWVLVCKASSQKQGWMKTTKALAIGEGCLVQTETQQKNLDGSYSLSQALTFVSDITIDDLKGQS